MFDIPQRCDSLLARPVAGRGQRQDGQSLHVAAELSTGEAIHRNIDRHEESEDVEKRVWAQKLFVYFATIRYGLVRLRRPLMTLRYAQNTSW